MGGLSAIRRGPSSLRITRFKGKNSLRWSETINIGLKGLLLRKFRSLLSTLGVVFGVAAVVSMVSVGEGARLEAVEQIKLLGTNNIRIKKLLLTGERREEAARRFAEGLTYSDALVVRDNIPNLHALAPLKFINADIRFEGRQAVAQIVGTAPEYQPVTNFRVGTGRFVTQVDLTDTKSICILGSEVKQELFHHRDPLGAVIRIGGSQFTVVGVMEEKVVRKGRNAAIKVRNINKDVYIPITTALRRFPGSSNAMGIEEIAVRAERAQDLPRTAALIREVLERRHRGAEDYEVMIPEELLAQAQRTQRLFNVIIGSIAGISLIVGGIGIMNIMLANVSERTREIGIRRALGATKRDILFQFLVETVLICLVGGAIGVVLGFGLAQVISLYALWTTAFSYLSVLVAFGTSVLLGLLFGLFPVSRAAELHPVQALRL